MTLIRNTEEAP